MPGEARLTRCIFWMATWETTWPQVSRAGRESTVFATGHTNVEWNWNSLPRSTATWMAVRNEDNGDQWEIVTWALEETRLISAFLDWNAAIFATTGMTIWLAAMLIHRRSELVTVIY